MARHVAAANRAVQKTGRSCAHTERSRARAVCCTRRRNRVSVDVATPTAHLLQAAGRICLVAVQCIPRTAFEVVTEENARIRTVAAWFRRIEVHVGPRARWAKGSDHYGKDETHP